MFRDKQTHFMVLALAASLLAAGCGKDKTLDQYQRDQANAQLAQQQIAAGTFRGTLVNQANGQPLSAVEITLNATQIPISDGSGTGSVGRSVLQGSVKLVSGIKQTSAAITTGGYVPSSDRDTVGSVTATISVTLGSGNSSSTAGFVMNARFDNGTLSGTIVPNASGLTGSFTAVRGAPMPHVGQGSTLPGEDESRYYAGHYVKKRCLDPRFKDTIYCRNIDPSRTAVSMTVNMNPANSGTAFVNVFSDVKSYYVKLAFGQVIFTLPSAEYTPAAGTLSFQGVAVGDTSPVTLACRAQGTGYSCSFDIESANDSYSFDLAQQSRPGN